MSDRYAALRNVRALSVGYVTHDRYRELPDQGHSGHRFRAGGSAFFAARAWHALRVHASVISSVGTDFACRQELSGIDWSCRTTGKTITFDNEHDEYGVAVRTVAGDAPPVDPNLLDDRAQSADIALLAPVFREINLAQWMDALDVPRVGLVLQGLIRQAGVLDPHSPRLVRPCLPDINPHLLRRLSLVVFSEDDLAGLGAKGDQLVHDMRASVPVVAMTRGKAGSVVFAGDYAWDIGVCRAAVVDPTGAGDVFAAVLLLGIGAQMSPEQSARMASAAASVIVEGYGASASETLPQLLHQRMKSVSVCAR